MLAGATSQSGANAWHGWTEMYSATGRYEVVLGTGDSYNGNDCSEAAARKWLYDMCGNSIQHTVHRVQL